MRIPSEPQRDGNVHVHKGDQWVVGTYHDGWHPIKRTHKGITTDGDNLHRVHVHEARVEMLEKERALTAEFRSQCHLCGHRIEQGENIWWHPKTKGVRHRGTSCDIDASVPRSSDAETQPKVATKKDLATFEDGIRAIADKFEQDKAALNERIEAAEQKAVIARKASEEAQRATRSAEAKINATRRLEVVRTTESGVKKVRKLRAQHVNFEKLLAYAQAGVNVAMVGDAGSGKTYAGAALAKALGLEFYHIPVGPQTSKSDLLGYMSGAGKYVYSLLCRVYERGGVGLLDEMDAANPATLTIINGMLEALEAGFADKMRERHPECIFVAGMNTFGRGADMMFVGRAQLDAATLSRWVWLAWDTDWDLAHRIVKDDKWVDYVQSLYNSASRQKVRVTIGMRTAILGHKLMKAGVSREEAEHAVVWAPIKPDDKQKILAGISTNGGELYDENSKAKEKASWR